MKLFGKRQPEPIRFPDAETIAAQMRGVYDTVGERSAVAPRLESMLANSIRSPLDAATSIKIVIQLYLDADPDALPHYAYGTLGPRIISAVVPDGPAKAEISRQFRSITPREFGGRGRPL